MEYLSRQFDEVISEITHSGAISKDHFYINSLTVEDKYELIRMESKGWLKIENGAIKALDNFREALNTYYREAI